MVYAIEGDHRGLNPRAPSFHFDAEPDKLERFRTLLTARTLAAVDEELIELTPAAMLISHINNPGMRIDGHDEPAFFTVFEHGPHLERARLGKIVLAGSQGQLDASDVATEARLLRAEADVVGYGNEVSYLTSEGYDASLEGEDHRLFIYLWGREAIAARYGSKNPVLKAAKERGADYFVDSRPLRSKGSSISDIHQPYITAGRLVGRKNKSFQGLVTDTVN